MKINVTVKNDYVAKIPVWFGQIKNGAIWKKSHRGEYDQIDFEQSGRRASLKKFLREQEDLERHLDKWAEERGF